MLFDARPRSRGGGERWRSCFSMRSGTRASVWRNRSSGALTRRSGRRTAHTQSQSHQSRRSRQSRQSRRSCRQQTTTTCASSAWTTKRRTTWCRVATGASAPHALHVRFKRARCVVPRAVRVFAFIFKVCIREIWQSGVTLESRKNWTRHCGSNARACAALG